MFSGFTYSIKLPGMLFGLTKSEKYKMATSITGSTYISPFRQDRDDITTALCPYLNKIICLSGNCGLNWRRTYLYIHVIFIKFPLFPCFGSPYFHNGAFCTMLSMYSTSMCLFIITYKLNPVCAHFPQVKCHAPDNDYDLINRLCDASSIIEASIVYHCIDAQWCTHWAICSTRGFSWSPW